MFFVLSNVSLINLLQRVQIRNRNQYHDRDRERFISVLMPQISEKTKYLFCRNLCETDSLSGLYLYSSSTPFSSVLRIQQLFKNRNPVSYVASNQTTELISSTHSSYLRSNIPSHSPTLSQNLISHKPTPISSPTFHLLNRSHPLSSPTS
jgi:hypothetical protein